MLIALIICILIIAFLFYGIHSNNQSYAKAVAKAKSDYHEFEAQKEELQLKINDLYIDLQERNQDVDKIQKKYNDLIELEKHRKQLYQEALEKDVEYYPFLAGEISDFLTYVFEIEAKKLDWGSNVQREKKVKSIRAIRKETQEQISEAKVAIYQLEYLKKLYPALEDVLDAKYNELDLSVKAQIPDYDPIRPFLTKEEWNSLNETEKNQLALDRYVESHKKSKWQIGRDYELSCGYEFFLKGYTVDYFGSYKGLEDLGRDLIISKPNETQIILAQCKYWSAEKKIHEKHIFQLYGTSVSYGIEKNINPKDIIPLFITNISLSDTAKKVAEYLNIIVWEQHEMKDYPRIKCNINIDEFGLTTHIYHLPMDLQYDKCKIDKPGECFAFTVKEAEQKGFRRAYKWFGK